MVVFHEQGRRRRIDAELLELVELEVRELLSAYEFPWRRHSGDQRFGVEGSGR
jgi:translation elongation factor EF-Tu-like GTPase